MEIKKLSMGSLGANCYIVSEKGRAAVIDPGAYTPEISYYAQKNSLTIEKILLTHGHFDHVSGADGLREETGAQIYISKPDAELLQSEEKSLANWDKSYGFAPFSADRVFSDGDEIPFGDKSFKVMLTPGHTKGSACFLIDDKIFCGDLIFCGSVGRSDVYSSNTAEHMESLKRLKSLCGDYTLYCGHGEDTSLSAERKFNMYLQGL